MNRSFVDTMRSTGQFSSHFVTLSSDVDKFGKNLASGRMKLSEYYSTWQNHAKKTSTIVKDLAKQQVMLQNSVVQPLGRNAQGLMQYNVMVARGLDENANKMQLLRQEQAIMNRVMQDGSNQLINWGKNTQWAGRQLTVGLTVPLAAFGAAASRAFLTADSELVRLTKVYGGLTQTSAEDLAKIRKDIAATAKELAVQYGASYKDSIALAADLAATGLQGNALVSATKETTRLAVLGEVDRQDAMKATLAIQNAFKQSTEELTQSIDFLNAVENQTSTSLGDLVEAIPKAGPVVKSLGGDVKDLALYLTAMKEGGVNASEGANAIKSALASLINPTKVAKEMFSGFGIDLAGIVSSNAGDLTGTIMSLQKALDSLDPLSKSKAIEQLFGKFQFARMSALFENLGKQGSQTLQVLDLMKASTQDLANISAREMKQMTESASGQYKRALESVKADMAAAGESFLKISTFVLKAIDGIVKFITDLPGPIKSILTFVGGLTALAGPLIMLTGVLGNFFGYIIKGIFNLKQFFKGGSAFKLLTPEIMAAEAAAKAVGDSFYSDAKAAKVFEDAVLGLARSFEILQTKAAMATRATHSSVSMSTVGGGAVTTGSGFDRVVNKDSQYLGKPYSRDMSHTIPSGEEQLGTIFGVVPGTGPVNRKISNNPQMYMDGDLPRIPGITSVNSVSTGIVASEAARWHAMTAAIAMQSKEELALLRQEVAATGTVTTQLSSSYSAMLPPMVELTSLAAAEGAAIVAQLQQGKITVDQARAKIIALNYQVEAMMAETAQMTAATMGRTVNLTTVPLTSQPTVDPITGKSNMKEMFHKGATASLVDKIARSLGVRTSGGGYSTETTLPIVRKNDGGMVYDPSRHGSVVPGPANVNYDIIPARLPEGSYILNQQASRNNPDLVNMAQNKYSGGGRVVNALLTPKETYFDPEFTAANKPLLDKANSGSRIELRNTGGMLGGLVTRGIKNYGNIAIDSTDPVTKFIQYYAGTDREDLRLAAVAADASTLRSLGLPTDDAIFEATKWFDDRWRETLSLNDGVFSQDIFNQITTDDLPKFEKRLRKQEKYKGKLHKKRLSMPVKNRTVGGASLTRKDWQYVGPTSAYEKIASRNEVLEAMAASSLYEKEKVTRLIATANRFGDGPNNGVQVAHFTPGSSPNTPIAGIDHLGRAALQPWEINQIQDSLSSYGIFSSDFSLDPAENISMLDRAAMEHGYADHKDMLNKIVSRETVPANKNTMRTSRGLTTTMQAVLDKKPKEFRGWLANRAMLMSKFKIRQAANAGGLIGGLVKRGKHGYGNVGGLGAALNSSGRLASNTLIRSLTPEQKEAYDKTTKILRTYSDDKDANLAIDNALKAGVPKQLLGKNLIKLWKDGYYPVTSLDKYDSLIKSLATKESGTFFRGTGVSNNPYYQGKLGTLPPEISSEIHQILTTLKGTERDEALSKFVGKTFKMRTSSWTTNESIASDFAKNTKAQAVTKKDVVPFTVKTSVQDEDVIPVHSIFKDKYLHDGVPEDESMFGGNFVITGINSKGVSVERVAKVTKRNSGGMVGGLVKSGKYGYGNESPAALRLKAFAAAQQIRRDAEHKKNLEKFPWIKPQIDAYRDSQKDPLFLGMPRSFKKVQDQRKARLTMEEIDFSLKTSQFANMDPTDFGVLQKASSGHSFPVEGIAGVYKKPDGSIVFVKPVMHETEALAEQRATTIARGAHEMGAPTQEIRTMFDPTDPTKKRKLIVLESKYDPIFDQANDGVFTQQDYFKQLVAANLRGDKDLSIDNIQGSIVNDVGTSGVFKMASSAQGKREYYGEMVDGRWVDGMPSMKEQARINLLGVKGGAKKFFAESTLDIPKGMTPAQYHQAMIDEIDSVLPRLRQVISGMNLNATERQVYGAMIKRLEDGRLVNWEEFHAIHSAVKPSAPKALTPAALLKLKTEAELRMRQRGHSASLSNNSFKNDANGFNIGGMVQAREKGGPVNSGQPYLVGEKGPELFVPKNNGGIVSSYALGGMVRSNKFGYGDKFIGPQPYGVRSAFSAGVRGINTGSGKPFDPNSGMGASMAGMGLMMGGQGVGGSAGSAMTNVGMAMQMYPLLKMMGPQIKGLTSMTGIITKLGVIGPRVFNAIGLAIKFMMGPIGLFMIAATGVYILLKKIMAENAQDAKEYTLINAMTQKGAKEAGIKYNNLSDSIKNVNDQLANTKAKGLAAYESLTKIGVIGISYSIQESKAAIKDAKANKKDLVEGFSNAGGGIGSGENNDVERLKIITEMATNLKIQMVLSGKSVQDATNQIYAIISASKNADLAFKAITGASFVEVTDKTTAATSSIERLNKALAETQMRNGAANTLVGNDLGVALSNTALYLDANMNALIGTKNAQNEVIDAAEAYKIIMEQINTSAGGNTKLTQMQVDSLKETHPALEAILNKTDDIGSVLAKWRLLLNGVDIDLKGITGSEAVAVASFVAIQQAALDAQEESGKGVLGRSQKIITKLQDSIGKNLAAAQKAHSKQMSNAQDEIKAIDKKIAKINEEAEARKRALQDIENVESNALQMQLLQIDYQAAIATGDMDAAAAAQIKITQLEKQIQTAAALQAIEDKRIADVKKEEARKQRVQEEVEKNAKRLAALQEEASKNQIRLSKIQEYQLRYEQLIKDKMRLQAEGDPVKYAELEKAYIGNVKLLGLNLSSDAKSKDSKLSDMVKDIFAGSMISDSGESLATVKSSMTYNPGVAPIVTNKYGEAFGALDAATKETEKTIKGLGGGKTLFDVYTAILDGHRSARTAVMVQGTYSTEDKDGDKGILTKQGKEFVVRDNAITPGEYFKYNGWTYRMDTDGSVIRGKKYQSGGYISGPGTETSDSIPAYLSNGEYVIKASSVAKYGTGTFDALNAGKYADGGPVRKLGTARSMIETAESMLGYREGRNNDTLFGRFAQKVYDLKTKYIAWCGAFINWAAKKSGVDLASMIWTPGGAQSFKSTGKWTQNPVRGDLAFMNFPGDGVNRISHVGLVRNVLSKNAVSTIEGNTASSGNQRLGGGVFIKRRKYNEKGAPIVGFGRPSYKPVDIDADNVDPDNVKYQTSDQAKLNYENSRYTVKKGDTLSAISKKYGIPLKSLIKMNPHLNDPKYKGGSRIFAGTELSIKKFASGGKVTDSLTPDGYIRGAGSATSDSIPAMLSNGEYVIKADSVKKYGTETFDALNSQKFATGGHVAPKPFGQLNPAIDPNSIFGGTVQGLLKYLSNLPKDMVTSAISGGKYMAGAATGNPNWMDPKDEKMYQQALRDKENGQFFKGASSVMGRFATSAVDVIPKLINWNKLWAKAGMKDLPGQTEYLLAQLPGEVIQDLFKNLIPGNYAKGGLAGMGGIPRFHDGGPVGHKHVAGSKCNICGYQSPLLNRISSALEQTAWYKFAKKDPVIKDAGAIDTINAKYEDVENVGPLTENEAKVAEWAHAWGALLNTYYGAKYNKILTSAGAPDLIKEPIVTNLQVTNPRNIYSLLNGYKLGVAGGDVMMFSPPSTAGLAYSATMPRPGADGELGNWKDLPMIGPEKFDVKKYSDYINKKILTDDTYKMSLLQTMFHEYGHNMQQRFRTLRYLNGSDDSDKSKLFKGGDKKFLELNDTAEVGADFLSGSIMSEMYNAGYMQNMSSSIITGYLKKQNLAKDSTTGIPLADPEGHPSSDAQRFDLYLRGFKNGDTDTALADYLGMSLADFSGDDRNAKETVQRLLKFDAGKLDVTKQNEMPDLFTKQYAEILGIKANPKVRTLPTPSIKKLDLKTPDAFAAALIQKMGGIPTNGLIKGMRAWAYQEGGHWNNKALYNPLNTTLEMPGSTKVNTVNKKTGSGVQAYTSWEQGIDAVIKTLGLNPKKNGYDKIVEAIMTAKQYEGPERLYTALNNSNWGYPKYKFNNESINYYNPNKPFDGTTLEWYSDPGIPKDPDRPPPGWPDRPFPDQEYGNECFNKDGDWVGGPNCFGTPPDFWDIPDWPDQPGGGPNGSGIPGSNSYSPETQDIDWIDYARPKKGIHTFGTKTLLSALKAVNTRQLPIGVSIVDPGNGYDIFHWGGSDWAKPQRQEGIVYGFKDGARYNLQDKQYAEGTVTNVIDKPDKERWYYQPNGALGTMPPPFPYAFSDRKVENRIHDLQEAWFMRQVGPTGWKNGRLTPGGKPYIKFMSTFPGGNAATTANFANGGYVNPSYSANLSIPKFENGINMVPADMLALLHKNEAVIPAVMNPFNPNANAYDMKSGSEYNINVTLNGSNLTPDDVAKAISREMQLRDSMAGRSRNK